MPCHVGEEVEFPVRKQERLPRHPRIGDVTAHRLVLGGGAFVVEGRRVCPLLPPDPAVRHDHPVLDRRYRVIGGEGGETLLDPGLVVGRDGEGVPPPDEVAARDAEVTAVGVVREGDGAVGEPAADQLGLALHDHPAPLLAPPEGNFSLAPGRNVPDVDGDARTGGDGTHLEGMLPPVEVKPAFAHAGSAGLRNLPEKPDNLVVSELREQVVDALSDRFLHRAARETGGHPVPGEDAAVPVQGEECVADVLGQFPVPVFALPEGFLDSLLSRYVVEHPEVLGCTAAWPVRGRNGRSRRNGAAVGSDEQELLRRQIIAPAERCNGRPERRDAFRVEMCAERRTLQPVGSDAEQECRRPVRLQDDAVRARAEANRREVEKSVAISLVCGVDAPDAGDQRVDLIVDLGKNGFEQEQVPRGSRIFAGPERAETAIEILQVFEEVFKRRGERLHT
ncbi:hypothetical protein DSECCO2_608790 [anaerobic digester metagenome]